MLAVVGERGAVAGGHVAVESPRDSDDLREVFGPVSDVMLYQVLLGVPDDAGVGEFRPVVRLEPGVFRGGHVERSSSAPESGVLELPGRDREVGVVRDAAESVFAVKVGKFGFADGYGVDGTCGRAT